MRRYNSNLAFVDLLFNLLVGFTSLFVIAFLLINPISKTGEVTPPTVMLIEMAWDKESIYDMDLWFRGPDGEWVSYRAKDNGYATLERDDLGSRSDTYIINGESITVARNYEVISLSDLPSGEYVVNVHFFSRVGPATQIDVKVATLSPYIVIYDGTLTATPRQDNTAVSFVINREGKAEDINTFVQIPSGFRRVSGAP